MGPPELDDQVAALKVHILYFDLVVVAFAKLQIDQLIVLISISSSCFLLGINSDFFAERLLNWK
jgi:hypothetical protein